MRLILPAAAFCVLALSAQSGAIAEEPRLMWTLEGLHSPESVIYDAQRERLYVSNLATRGKERIVDDGFISAVGLDGEMIEQRWVEGMDDPKGLTIANGKLYAADTAEVLEIDPDKGTILARYRPEDGEPGRFNDCTADPDGNVYVYSSRLETVYRLKAGSFEPWAKVDTSLTGGVNGLRAETDRLILGGWTVTNSEGNQQLGHLNTIQYRNMKQGRIGTTPVSRCDGIEPDGLGGYTVTDWLTGDVTQVSATGETRLVMTLVRGTADHEYLIEDGVLYLPSMEENKLDAYAWRPTP